MRALNTLLTLARRASWAVRRRGPVILMYHRIAECGADPWNLTVSPRHFAEQLDVLTRYRRVMSLGELVERQRSGALPPNAASITFDDGYADNLHAAKPLLERFATPATVFVATTFLDGTGEPWWDELSALLADRKSLLDVHQRLKALPDEDRRHALARLRRELGAPPRNGSGHRMLTTPELLTLAEGNLVEVGAHTATHPSLPRLDKASQYAEIHHGKALLEERLNRAVRSFAYPYGDHDAITVSVAREAGVGHACTTAGRVVRPDDDPLRLPRFAVADWNGDEFAARFCALRTGLSLDARTPGVVGQPTSGTDCRLAAGPRPSGPPARCRR